MKLSKHFFASDIVTYEGLTRLLIITCILWADKYGFINAARPGIERLARLGSHEDFEKAMANIEITNGVIDDRVFQISRTEGGYCIFKMPEHNVVDKVILKPREGYWPNLDKPHA